MINFKKIEMAYEKYKSNFISGIVYEDIQDEYEECRDEITSIIESNNTEQDHILLIDLDVISSYWLSSWKKKVLIEKDKSTEELKKLQMIVLFQCMVQDIYKVRYPNMLPDYQFKDVIIALIHFTMFGWEKEEDLLFEFICKNIGSNVLDANDWNQHIWFLLELYLQYRNKDIFKIKENLHISIKEKMYDINLKGDLIPESLGVYEQVLQLWNTDDLELLGKVMNEMIDYHSILASEIGNSLEFGDFKYGFYPYEILFLIKIREDLSLPVPELYDGFLMNTPEAKMTITTSETYPEWDPLLCEIDKFYRKNYPEYIPNMHGQFFQ